MPHTTKNIREIDFLEQHVFRDVNIFTRFVQWKRCELELEERNLVENI